MAAATIAVSSSSLSCAGKVAGQNFFLRPLSGGLVAPAGVGEGGRGLAATLGLPGQDPW